MEGAYTLECFSDEHVHLEKIADVRRKVLICPNMSQYALICPHMTYYDLIYTLECFSDEHVHLEKIADVRRKVHIRIHWAAIRTC